MSLHTGFRKGAKVELLLAIAHGPPISPAENCKFDFYQTKLSVVGDRHPQHAALDGRHSHKYDLIPYSTTLSTPSTSSAHNYTHHRPSKREYIESSDVEDVPSSPPRKIRARPKRRLWRDSSDIGYSSDVDEYDRRVLFEDGDAHIRRRTRTVAGGENLEEMFTSSQAGQETSTSKFHRILSNAIMDGLDSLDFSYVSLLFC
jgi:hypothetical protein